jgi:hypothetical protein
MCLWHSPSILPRREVATRSAIEHVIDVHAVRPLPIIVDPQSDTAAVALQVLNSRRCKNNHRFSVAPIGVSGARPSRYPALRTGAFCRFGWNGAGNGLGNTRAWPRPVFAFLRNCAPLICRHR